MAFRAVAGTSESSSSIISSGGPEPPCWTEGRREGCREPYMRGCDPWTPKPGPKDRGLPRAAALASPDGHPSTPQRLLSTEGLGNSVECVDTGRGDAGRRPNEVKDDGQPSFLCLSKNAVNALLLGAVGASTSESATPSTPNPEILLFRFRELSIPVRPPSCLGMDWLCTLPSPSPSSAIVDLCFCLMPNMLPNRLP